MGLAYLGTSDFAVTVLQGMVAAGERPDLVVTPPDRARGRGRTPRPTPVAVAAEELGIAVHRTARVNEPESLETIAEAGIGQGMVCAFGQILGSELLDRVPLLNVHPSLLPRWRGAAPIERAIMAGDAETGTTIMRVTEGLDSGPMAAQRTVPITDQTFGELAPRLAQLGAELAVEALRDERSGTIALADQDDGQATYAEKIDRSERALDPGRPAVELARTVRALTPHIGTQLPLEGGQTLGVIAVRALPGGPGQGALSEVDGVLVLGCAEGALAIDEVRPSGGRTMAAHDYLRGHPVPRPAT
ncbi:MAG: methionyl-tRNA formyltransferase [Solirubrobacterales bacterium]